MLEYEKKIMLTVDEYLSILILKCRHLRMNTQTNYYFDDDDFSMNKKGITCRIREKGGKYKSTVKNHNTRYPNLSVEVDLAETTKFYPQIFNAFGLHNKGELVTQRIVMYKDSNCEMVLDRNLYLGYEDFELEVEYVEGAEEKAQALIDDIAEFLVVMQHLNEAYELSVRVDKGACKSQRFFERRKNY